MLDKKYLASIFYITFWVMISITGAHLASTYSETEYNMALVTITSTIALVLACRNTFTRVEVKEE